MPLPVQPKAANGAPAPAVATHSLGECIAIGLANRPNIKAAQHSLNASALGHRALSNLSGVADILQPDLPIRRKQSMRGISIAAADVEKARHETTYDVTRMYYTYIYALQQEQTAANAIESMEVYYDVAKKIVEEGLGGKGPGGKRIDNFTLYGLQNMISDVRLQKLRAEMGRLAALEALKEAMGVGSCYEFVPRATELPLMAGTVTKEQVVELALCRRPELVMASVGVDVFRLEIEAQAKNSRSRRVPTLAAGSDLHAKTLPVAERGTDYRPGPVAPELPTFLVGKADDRVARMTEFAYRQEAVYESVANLIRLEAANAYINWLGATRRLDEAKRVHERARKQVEDAKTASAARPDPELVVNSEGVAGRAQAAYVEAVFEHVKALAALERVTAGGLPAAFPGR
jgi:outer membrane protein TolC